MGALTRISERGPLMDSPVCPEPLARFRLYPESDSRLYALVSVWSDPETMAENCACEGTDVHGGCCGTLKIRVYGEAGRYERTKGIFAEVHMHIGALGTGVLAHELFHATVAWGRRLGFDFTRLDADDSVNDDEERLAYAHGKMCADFVNRAIRAGLYE